MQAIYNHVVYDTEKAERVWSWETNVGAPNHMSHTLYKGNGEGLFFLVISQSEPKGDDVVTNTYLVPMDMYFFADRLPRSIGNYSLTHCARCVEGEIHISSLDWAEEKNMPGDLFLKLFEGYNVREA